MLASKNKAVTLALLLLLSPTWSPSKPAVPPLSFPLELEPFWLLAKEAKGHPTPGRGWAGLRGLREGGAQAAQGLLQI